MLTSQHLTSLPQGQAQGLKVVHQFLRTGEKQSSSGWSHQKDWSQHLASYLKSKKSLGSPSGSIWETQPIRLINGMRSGHFVANTCPNIALNTVMVVIRDSLDMQSASTQTGNCNSGRGLHCDLAKEWWMRTKQNLRVLRIWTAFHLTYSNPNR
jgi:hypothetical protein